MQTNVQTVLPNGTNVTLCDEATIDILYLRPYSLLFLLETSLHPF